MSVTNASGLRGAGGGGRWKAWALLVGRENVVVSQAARQHHGGGTAILAHSIVKRGAPKLGEPGLHTKDTIAAPGRTRSESSEDAYDGAEDTYSMVRCQSPNGQTHEQPGSEVSPSVTFPILSANYPHHLLWENMSFMQHLRCSSLQLPAIAAAYNDSAIVLHGDARARGNVETP